MLERILCRSLNCSACCSTRRCATATSTLAGLSNADGPYEAATYCDGLTEHGHADGYLAALGYVPGAEQIVPWPGWAPARSRKK